MSDPMDWVAASLLPGIGPATLLRLHRSEFPVSALISGQADALDLAGGATRLLAALDHLHSDHHDLGQRLNRIREWLIAERIELIVEGSESYPALLTEISDPPVLLYCRGEPSQLCMPQVAIVGSRRASAAGRDTARTLARELSVGGISVTSGLAEGIDAAAHRGCLEGDQPTVAVFGTGLDKVYPAKHQTLASEIIDDGGCWVSEYPPFSPSYRGNFPRRNRIISGLSAGVVVVEAAEKSGSLVSARLALEQGREVFAVPGSVHNPQTAGCHQLIRQGAVLTCSAADVVEQLPALLSCYQANDAAEDPEASMLPDNADPLLQMMGYDVCSLDRLVASLKLEPAAAMIRLTELELAGVIEVVPGGYQRKR